MYTKSVKILLGLLFISCFKLTAQELLKPEFVGFKHACAKGSFNDFKITVEKTASFGGDNIFYIELSNANGLFNDPNDPLKSIKTIPGENGAGLLSTSFQVPPDTFGRGFKLRIRSTSPKKFSPESDVFQAYDMFPERTMELNGVKDAVICEGGSYEMKLNTTKKGSYQWFKDNVFFVTTEEPKLTVTEGGSYQARVDYGACGKVQSTVSLLTVVDASQSEIKGGSPVQICANETHVFEATVKNDTYTYTWYKDGQQVSSSSSHTYETPSTNQFGTYYLEVGVQGCVSRSSNVILEPKTAASFEVTTSGPLETLLLPNETKELCISHTAPATAKIQWYRNGNSLASKEQLCMNATESGCYYAVVTDASSDCSVEKKSEEYCLVDAKSFKPVIRADLNYEGCKSTKVELSVVGVDGVGVNDKEYPLSKEQIDVLDKQWYKDNELIAGEIEDKIIIDSYEKNGAYSLEVSSRGILGKSNVLNVLLTIEDPEITSSSLSNALCENDKITLKVAPVVAGFTYEWFKDGEDTPISVADPSTLEVGEVGEYELVVSGFGCEKRLEKIKIVKFDEGVVNVTPSGVIVMDSSGTVIVTASGADSYEWFDDKNNLLSSTEKLEVNKIGFYILQARVGNCLVTKKIEVVEDDGKKIVPNIVSPTNGDGINDTWEIPNRFAYHTNVQIQIYDSKGKKVLETVDYQNDWPTEDLGTQKIFYYRIIKDASVVKAGTISVLD
ncbi:Putative adhesin precursor SprC [Tenacibaculum maritimum]|uniref:Ig-like domain-containing protein n=1 Tax=Tenacibaculum maritimum TaxID=107401 RepID=UPI0012E68ABC|nr:gliding motility-associated C-terminal domain-containing protein [Tenacibaculum maritimum]CAA0144963.1 Putative adhesin precursor SprC [Tenacibaculum maritimum]